MDTQAHGQAIVDKVSGAGKAPVAKAVAEGDLDVKKIPHDSTL